MLYDVRFYFVQFMLGISPVSFEPYLWHEPELGIHFLSLNVDVSWFQAITAPEDELVRANPENCRHWCEEYFFGEMDLILTGMAPAIYLCALVKIR